LQVPIEELFQKFEEIQAQNDKNRKSKNPKIKDSADCLKLIMMTGVRPGSEEDTGAAVKAYGATTLEGKHVVKTKDGVELQFVGKKGVSLKLKVDDPETATMLLLRSACI
jgi:DNA topoisomerase IB